MSTKTKTRETAVQIEPSMSGSMCVPELKISKISLHLIGDSPLIVHRFSEKAKKEMLDKFTGKASNKKPPKDPKAEYEGSLYKNKRGEYFFPAVAFKKAAIHACRQVDGIPMTAAKQLLHIDGEEAIILGSPPRMREDTVRLQGKTTDLRYRGEFWPWYTEIIVVHDVNCISQEQVANLFSLAGFGVGIGEWRPTAPNNSGPYGRFHVASEAQVELIQKGDLEAAIKLKRG